MYIFPGHHKDLGDGVMIRRYLPDAQHPSLGPYVFFDYLPEIAFAAGTGSDVRPHPHIGLSTLSYILEGQVHHQDSLGYDLVVQPGDILLMTSGKGITHSERTPQALRQAPHRIHMFQFWLALPKAEETREPSVHWAQAKDLPHFELQPGISARLGIGSYAEYQSPVSTFLNPRLLDLQITQACEFNLDLDLPENGIMLIAGEISLAGQIFQGPCLLALDAGHLEIKTQGPAQLLLLGGEPLDGHRRIWWNFVATDPEAIEEAKRRWRQGGFEMIPNDQQEFIPLPDEDPQTYAWNRSKS